MQALKVSRVVWEQIGPYYVYALMQKTGRDEDDYRVFYIGKGTGNRAEHHAAEWFRHEQYLEGLKGDARAKAEKHLTAKLREVHEAGGNPRIRILQSGIKDEEEAYKAESTAMEAIRLAGAELANVAPPHHKAQLLETISGALETVSLRADDRLVLLSIGKKFPGREISVEQALSLPSPEVREKTIGDWTIRQELIAEWSREDSPYRPTHIVGVYADVMCVVLPIDHRLMHELGEHGRFPVPHEFDTDETIERLQGRCLLGANVLFKNFAAGPFYAGSDYPGKKVTTRWEQYLREIAG
ncbi:GIY-YIG nuclease family protein [Arthrobacter sp. 754]|uniref:GIY-YIG nuclease family protein n=1 Tax=Arthrobacter sp. 754 TaxID=3156315 RepID=UPI0033968A3B